MDTLGAAITTWSMSCLSFGGPLVNRTLMDHPERAVMVAKAQPGPLVVLTIQEDDAVTK